MPAGKTVHGSRKNSSWQQEKQFMPTGKEPMTPGKMHLRSFSQHSANE